MAARFGVRHGEATGRVLLIVGLMFSLPPHGMAEDLIRERTSFDDAARPDAATSWSAPPTSRAPITTTPLQLARMPHPSLTITHVPYLLPAHAQLGGILQPEQRFRELGGTRLFPPRLSVAGGFVLPPLGMVYRTPVVPWGQMQGLHPGGTHVLGVGPPLVALYAALGHGAPTAPAAFSFELVLQYALAFGALGLFTMLAVFTYATRGRNEDRNAS